MNGNGGRELAILNDGNGDDRALVSAMIRLTEYSERNRSDEALSALQGLLSHGSINVRRYAAIALGKLGMAGALPLLQTLCDDSAVQGAALHAMRLIGSEAICIAALRALRNGNEEARREAILALEERGERTPEVIEELRNVAESGDDLPARMAQRALSKLCERI